MAFHTITRGFHPSATHPTARTRAFPQAKATKNNNLIQGDSLLPSADSSLLRMPGPLSRVCTAAFQRSVVWGVCASHRDAEFSLVSLQNFCLFVCFWRKEIGGRKTERGTDVREERPSVASPARRPRDRAHSLPRVPTTSPNHLSHTGQGMRVSLLRTKMMTFLEFPTGLFSGFLCFVCHFFFFCQNCVYLLFINPFRSGICFCPEESRENQGLISPGKGGKGC